MANRKTTWTDITPAYIDMLLDPHFSHEAKQDAIENLMRMAAALDAFNGDAFEYDLKKKQRYVENALHKKDVVSYAQHVNSFYREGMKPYEEEE